MRVLLKGLPPYEDGEYNVDGPYTMQQLHDFNILAGVLPTDFEVALAMGNAGLIVCLAKIGLERKAHEVHLPVLWSAVPGQILLDFRDEDDAVPPPSPSDELGRNGDEPTESSGTSGNETGGSPQESDPNGTGTPSPDDTE